MSKPIESYVCISTRGVSSMKSLSEILQDIAPYVIVTGSYAFGTQKATSDIDFYVKARSDEDREKECEETGIDWSDTEETYVPTLIRYFESLGYEWSSCFIESFAIDETDIPLEFSSFYSIDNQLFDIEICGVKLTASRSNYTGGKYINGQKLKNR